MPYNGYEKEREKLRKFIENPNNFLIIQIRPE